MIKNDRDPVFQVPLTLQIVFDVMAGGEEDNAGKGDFFEHLTLWNAVGVNEIDKNKNKNKVFYRPARH